MRHYLDMARDIMERGWDVDTRNGKVRKLFAHQLRFDLQEGFPAMTTKRLVFKPVKAELLWFIEGGRKTGGRLDNNRLRELMGYGPDQRTIWSEDAESARWKPKARFPGDCGRIYGAQWRNWRHRVRVESNAMRANPRVLWDLEVIDQLAIAIDAIRNDPWDRQRKIVTARNPAELDDMCLAPCHERFQFFVEPDEDGRPKRLSVHMVQRSCDVFLGVPFNIASYALLLAMVAQVTGLEAHEVVIDFIDVHVYHIHFEQMSEQLAREPLPPPRLWLNPAVKRIDDFTMDDIALENYRHHPPIAAELAKDKLDQATA